VLAKLALAGLGVCVSVAIACDDEAAPSWREASFAELVEVADMMEGASFAATYEVESNDAIRYLQV